MKYVFEKDINMPLCAKIGELYFDCLTGKMIENPDVLNFIKRGLVDKRMEELSIDLKIYKITCIKHMLGHEEVTRVATIGYIFSMNGYSSYVDKMKQPFSYYDRRTIVENLMKGRFTQELIWGAE